jgi:hypothetical protein
MSSANTSAHSAVDAALLAQYLSYMPTGNVMCPSCHGGDSREKSFRLWRTNDFGGVRGRCWRASCSYALTMGVRPEAGSVAAAPQAPALRPYTGGIYPLPADEVTWFRHRYGYEPREVFQDGYGLYVLPIYGPFSDLRGYILRQPHKGSAIHKTHYIGPKAVTYRHIAAPMQAWYRRTGCAGVAVLVEDQLSAMKVAQQARMTAVALLGTALTAEKVADLQQRVKRVVIALDPDATSIAFDHARKWGQAFESCRVMVLKEDIKDARTDTWIDALHRIEAPAFVS